MAPLLTEGAGRAVGSFGGSFFAVGLELELFVLVISFSTLARLVARGVRGIILSLFCKTHRTKTLFWGGSKVPIEKKCRLHY